MICDYAQLLGAFGGKFLDASGKPAFQTGGGLQALQFMKMLLDEGLADPASTSSLEADVLKAFAAGQDRDEPQLDLPARRSARSQRRAGCPRTT